MNQLHTLQNIFTSNFYIDGRYAMSFAPSIIQALTGNATKDVNLENYREKLIANSQSDSNLQNSEKRVVILSIKQPILKFDAYGYGLGSKTFISILKNLEHDPSVLGVVLDIDSGGGQVYGTPEFHDALLNFSKPIVTYTDGYLCSAAYYIGNGTDYIVANKRADAIGSIGALAHWLDFTGIFEKLGATSHLMYATKSTEKNAEARAIIENNDPKPYIKEVLDPIVETFINDMKAKRPQLNEEVFKGNTWGAEQSLQMGLIDEIGTIENAISKVVELANHNSENSNQTDMSSEGKSFPKIAAALGLEDVGTRKQLFSSTETASLTVDQLEKLEAALTDPGNSEQIQSLSQQLADANAAKATAETNATNLVNAVNAAITEAGLESENAGTVEGNIQLLASKVVEYGAKDGAETTNVHSNGDPGDENDGEGVSTSIFDSFVNS